MSVSKHQALGIAAAFRSILMDKVGVPIRDRAKDRRNCHELVSLAHGIDTRKPEHAVLVAACQAVDDLVSALTPTNFVSLEQPSAEAPPCEQAYLCYIELDDETVRRWRAIHNNTPKVVDFYFKLDARPGLELSHAQLLAMIHGDPTAK